MWIPLHQPKKILQRFLIILFRCFFDFDVSVANDVAIDVVICVLPGKVMQESPCPEVRTLTNENGRYIMKLNGNTYHHRVQTVQKCTIFLFATYISQ